MAVYLFTLHTYRSWMPDHKRGYVKRKQGILSTDEDRAEAYTRRANHERFLLTGDHCDTVIATTIATCGKYHWQPHAIIVVPNHLHVLISWRGYHKLESIRALLKRALTQTLRQHLPDPRQPVFSRAGSIKRVKHPAHYQHLMRHYLPAHGRYRGKLWFVEHITVSKTRNEDVAAKSQKKQNDVK